MPYQLKYGRGRGAGFTLPLASNGTAFSISGPYASGFSPAGTVITQVHCHTTSSDGSYSPAEVVAYYLAAGYGALAITDHNMVTAQGTGITLAISGNEVNSAAPHIISLNNSYTKGSDTTAQQFIDGIVAAGGQAEVAHPNWSAGATYDELVALTGYDGIEVFNGKCIGGAGQDPTLYGGYAIAKWDQLLSAGYMRWGFAVDDLHNINSALIYDMGRLKVYPAANTVASVMAALGSGQFVADVSNHGVTIAYPTRSATELSLSATGATRIEAWGAAGLLSSTDSSSHTHTFARSDGYVRLVAIGDYTEPFSSALSDRWSAYDGTWAVSGGVLSVSADSTQRRLHLLRSRQSDFSAQVDINLSSAGTDGAALMFNVLSENYHYILRIGESVIGSWNDYLAVGKTTTGSFSGAPLASTAFNPTNGSWYTLKMAYTAATGRIQAKCWLRSDAEPGTWDLDFYDTSWTHGMFGLRANRSCQFDNLYIDGFQTFYQPVTVTAL